MEPCLFFVLFYCGYPMYHPSKSETRLREKTYFSFLYLFNFFSSFTLFLQNLCQCCYIFLVYFPLVCVGFFFFFFLFYFFFFFFFFVLFFFVCLLLSCVCVFFFFCFLNFLLFFFFFFFATPIAYGSSWARN